MEVGVSRDEEEAEYEAWLESMRAEEAAAEPAAAAVGETATEGNSEDSVGETESEGGSSWICPCEGLGICDDCMESGP